MRGVTALLLALVACAAAQVVEVVEEDGTYDYSEQTAVSEGQQQEPETVFRLQQDLDGSLRVTGVMQSYSLDSSSLNQLLTRPRTSLLDLGWRNWVDQRMEVLDMFQNLISPVPRCQHMRPEGGQLDTSMVSYLASSRFGPAILTTYAQKFQDDEEDDFDYEEVYIPEGESFSKSYEDASLLDDLSADADKAFRATDERLAGQQSAGLGFFGANIKTPQDQASYAAQLDGSSESLQPVILQDPPLRYTAYTFDNTRPQQPQLPADEFPEDPVAADIHQIAGFAIFLLLCIGCAYVWVSLLLSCCRMGKELSAKRCSEKRAAQKVAQDELLAPLMPEGAAKDPRDVEVAASHAPGGTYYAPHGSGYVTIAVPLVNGGLDA